MKKTFLTCMAVLALFAIAGSASAITCTVDTRPAATLLVPYFAVSLTLDGRVSEGGPLDFNTLLSIGNASQAPMLAHVTVWNQRSEAVLDFMVALTGFDIQTWRMGDVISGILPSTPINTDHEGPDTSNNSPDDACQRNPLAGVYPTGYLRSRPTLPADPVLDPLATTSYRVPAFEPNDDFGRLVIDSLDETEDSRNCTGEVDGITAGAAVGYVTIDHANYCSVVNPNSEAYYLANAIGAENNLFGDIIFVSGQGIGTYGMSMVALESDPSFAPPAATDDPRTRTFYARYWSAVTAASTPPVNPTVTSPWNTIVGDEREPLGLRWAVRYFVAGGVEGGGVASAFDVWRASSGTLKDLYTPTCDLSEPTVLIGFFDEDENTVTVLGPGPCPSPCELPPSEPLTLPFETQRILVSTFDLPDPLPGGINVGWASLNFVNPTTGTSLDQAWVGYEFTGTSQFISAHFPGIQLDPSSCEPLDSGLLTPAINPILPVIPGGVLGDGALSPPPAGTGPGFLYQ